MARPDIKITPINIPFSETSLVEETLPLWERALFEPTVALRDGEGIGGRKNALEAHLALPVVKTVDGLGVRALIGLQHQLAEEHLKLVLHVPESIGRKLACYGISIEAIKSNDLGNINNFGGEHVDFA